MEQVGYILACEEWSAIGQEITTDMILGGYGDVYDVVPGKGLSYGISLYGATSEAENVETVSGTESLLDDLMFHVAKVAHTALLDDVGGRCAVCG